MKIIKLFIVSSILFVTLSVTINSAIAQSPEPSPSPSPEVSPTPSPSASATPSPSSTPQATPTASPSQTAGGKDGSVLGEATTLGETNSDKEFAKWFLIAMGGILTFVFAIKLVRNDKEE